MNRKFNKIPKLHVRKGDTVKVLSGDKDIKGMTGKVLKLFPIQRKAIVEGINMITKHVKPNQKYPNGTILKVEHPLAVCKLQVVDPKTGKGTRVGRKLTEKGWVRYSKVSNELLNS